MTLERKKTNIINTSFFKTFLLEEFMTYQIAKEHSVKDKNHHFTSNNLDNIALGDLRRMIKDRLTGKTDKHPFTKEWEWEERCYHQVD